jgi:broad specificity phosphatase PhoE
MTGTKEIWFIRHGESLANAGLPTPDHNNIPLTAKGQAQAENVSREIPRQPDLIVMSEFIRTHLTAAPTRARFPDAPVAIWPVHEFTYLSPTTYNNTTQAQRHPASEAFWEKADPDHTDASDAESFSDLMRRARETLDLIRKADGDFVAIFSHAQFIRATRYAVTHPHLTDAELMVKLHRETDSDKVDNCQVIRMFEHNGQISMNPPQGSNTHDDRHRKKNPGLPG